MVANTTIAPGTLVMASRAFVLIQNEAAEYLYSARGATSAMNSQAAILPYVIRRVWKHPETAPDFYSLSGGRGLEGGSGGVTRVDVPRIVRILTNK